MNDKKIQNINSLITLLEVESGYVNQKGGIYDQNGIFIDFPRELGSMTRKNLDCTSVVKRFSNKTIACLIHQRINYSYYHWIYETLPKIIYLSNHKKEIKIDKIYYHCGFFGTSYQRQTIKKLGFNFWQLLDARRVQSLQAKKIIVVKLNEEKGNPSLELCKLIKSAFIKNTTIEPFKKIYLTRKHVNSSRKGRKVINETQVIELLKSYGFEVIVPDNLTVADQAILFSESKYIISPHGAALANIVFCHIGTRIIELFNCMDKSTWNLLYSLIAEKCNFELIPLAPEKVEKNNTNPHRNDFIVDLNSIETILKNWGLFRVF